MMGESVYVGSTEVKNVLVEVGLSKDIEKTDELSGARVDYTLRFPADATPPAHDAKVTVRGTVLDVLNVPDHWNCNNVFSSWSNPWDMNVLVGKSLGDFVDAIQVVSVSVTIDSLGDAVVTESVVLSGNAQARLKSGGESHGTALETVEKETWCFIVPWDDDFASLVPAATFIDYANGRYGVTVIERMENKQEYVLFEAVKVPKYRTSESGVSGG